MTVVRHALIGVFTLLVVAGTIAGADVEQEARRLEAMLIAPCCFSQQVSVHASPAADEVRRDIRKRLAAGETADQILQAYVSRYGKQVLAEPPAEGFDRILNVLPPLGLILTAALVIVVVRRFAGRDLAVPDATVDTSRVEQRYGRTLDDELRDLD